MVLVYIYIYANIGDILMGSMLPYIAYMDPMGHYIIFEVILKLSIIRKQCCSN